MQSFFLFLIEVSLFCHWTYPFPSSWLRPFGILQVPRMRMRWAIWYNDFLLWSSRRLALLSFLPCQHAHFLLALHARLSGVFLQSILNFLICPRLRAQKDFLRGPPPGWGGLRLEPVFLLIMALPLAVSPPLGSLHLFPILQPFIAPFFFAITVLLTVLVVWQD